MCLYTTKPAKIAEKPIIVYKILLLKNIILSIYCPPCQGNLVMINDTLKASVDTEPWSNTSLCIIEGEGVHAYTSIEKAKRSLYDFDAITKWEIPAGAKYWEGTGITEGEIAATEMKFIEVCEFNIS